MKKLKVLMLGSMLAAGICLFAACGTANDDGTNNRVEDTTTTQGTMPGNTQQTNPGTGNNTNNGNDTNNTNSTNNGSVGKDVENLGEDVVNGVEDAGDAVVDGVDDAVDAVDPDANANTNQTNNSNTTNR